MSPSPTLPSTCSAPATLSSHPFPPGCSVPCSHHWWLPLQTQTCCNWPSCHPPLGSQPCCLADWTSDRPQCISHACYSHGHWPPGSSHHPRRSCHRRSGRRHHFQCGGNKGHLQREPTQRHPVLEQGVLVRPHYQKELRKSETYPEGSHTYLLLGGQFSVDHLRAETLTAFVPCYLFTHCGANILGDRDGISLLLTTQARNQCSTTSQVYIRMWPLQLRAKGRHCTTHLMRFRFHKYRVPVKQERNKLIYKRLVVSLPAQFVICLENKIHVQMSPGPLNINLFRWESIKSTIKSGCFAYC